MRAYRALLRKDLLLELRGRELVPAMLAFVLGALLLVRFGLGGETQAGGTRAATGLLWVVVVFTSMLALFTVRVMGSDWPEPLVWPCQVTCPTIMEVGVGVHGEQLQRSASVWSPTRRTVSGDEVRLHAMPDGVVRLTIAKSRPVSRASFRLVAPAFSVHVPAASS